MAMALALGRHLTRHACSIGRAATGVPTLASAPAPALVHRQQRWLQTGLVGLPNVGKSTLFNAMLGRAAAEASNFPFCTIDPNYGSALVPDRTLTALGESVSSVRVVPTTVDIVDIAGIIKGASTGAGLGNQFLANIRECDAIIEVVRCFEDPEITHVDGSIDVIRDIDVIDMELALADLAMLEKATTKSKSKSRTAEENAVLERALDGLSNGQWASSLGFNKTELETLRLYPLLTLKPVIYAANVDEDDLATGNAAVDAVRAYASERGGETVVVSARTEELISELPEADRVEMLEALGVKHGEVGLDALVRAAYSRLDLITFYTCGPTETRAWTVRRGATAPEAAGRIHSDMQAGFIRADCVASSDLLEHGGQAACKEKGLVRTEGKAYIVNEGDVFLFHFRNK